MLAVIARETELDRLEAFVSAIDGPGALLVEGDAGIGKTTLWEAALELAERAGNHVLRCAPVEGETELSFAAVADLLSDSLTQALPGLPSPQRQALRVALLLDEPSGEPPDARAIGTAVLSVIRALATERPVVLAIDDEPDLDDASRSVLEYVVRRLGDEPVRLLIARRGTGAESPPLQLDASIGRLALRPLGLGAVHQLLDQRLGRSFARPTVKRLHTVSGGNPFFALELGRALHGMDASLEPDEPLPVPESLQQLMEYRFEALAPEIRRLLEIMAASQDHSASLVEALALRDGLAGAIDAAVAAGVVRADGERLIVAHPLLRAAIYARIGPERRRELHARLAGAVEPGGEAQAMHLALAATGPDEQAAAQLADAAKQARARGASSKAARLAEWAARLTPPEQGDVASRRAIVAAEHSVAAGDPARARAILINEVERLSFGPLRARALSLLSWVPPEDDALEFAARAARQALAEVGGDDRVEARTRLRLGVIEQAQGHLESAEEHGRIAAACAERCGDPGPLALAVTSLGYMEMLRRGAIAPDVERAVALESEMAARGWGTHSRGLIMAGTVMIFAGELDAARRLFRRQLEDAVAAGHDARRGTVLVQLAELERRAGRWNSARDFSDEARELAAQGARGQEYSASLLPGALMDAAAGDEREARLAALTGLSVAQRFGDRMLEIHHRGVLGFLELSLGDAAASCEWLAPASDDSLSFGVGEPGIHLVVHNEAEAALACGDHVRAELLVAHLEERAAATGRDWTAGVAARGRGLLLAHQGDNDGARARLGEALAAHQRAGQPLELGRTLLAIGGVERRDKQKRTSGEALDRAAEIFAALPAPAWQAKVEAEVARLGRRVESDELTATEARIASLAAGGFTNPEIAAEVFVSRKTVEANLSRIYRKLGVRSRVELARLLPADGKTSGELTD